MSELDLLADCLKDTTKERDELAAALEQAQVEIDRLQALHLERTKSTHKALTERDERIEQLEAVIQRAPCKVLLLQEQPYDDCFPLEPCEPCHCGRSLLAGDTLPPVDIRERFEAWAKLSSMSLAKDLDGEYVNLAVHGAWSAWQAGQSDVDYINWNVPVEDTGS